MSELVLSGAALKSAAATFDKASKSEAQIAYEEAFEAAYTVVSWKDKHVQQRLSRRYKGRNRLYAVTTFAKSESYGGTRTVGVFDWKSARKLVEHNEGDIYEYSYLFVVIESVMVNSLYGGMSRDSYWYAWDGDNQSGNYRPIETPAMFKNSVGFGIG